MLDPLPLVAKVFNLVVQKERQRTIGHRTATHSSESMAFSAISSSSSQPLAGLLHRTSQNEIDQFVLTVRFRAIQ